VKVLLLAGFCVSGIVGLSLWVSIEGDPYPRDPATRRFLRN